ncbi:TPA: transporter substrate-binding domain-containing protein [Pseudomonas aeruginosa]|nr:transporter substrate-binding domain-containing protein [Pseudomonas aeruginosa]HEJ6151352.1 transporter substrate-binding domain-containing protein [Pseudomonas aeruginosa]
MKPSHPSRRQFGLTLASATALAASGMLERAFAQTTSSAYDVVIKRGVLRVGWAPWFPYAFRDPKSNQVAGIAADLLKDLAASLKVELRLVEDSWGTMIAGLQADKFDMLMPMAVTPPREAAATFSNNFMKTDLGVMIRPADKAKYGTWHDLDHDGVNIAAAMGSNTALYAKQTFKKARIVEMKGEPESVTAVITGKADAWASTYSAFTGSAPGRSQLLVLPGEPFAYSPVALVVRKGDTTMVDQINAFLSQYRTSGALLAAVERQGLPATDILK